MLVRFIIGNNPKKNGSFEICILHFKLIAYTSNGKHRNFEAYYGKSTEHTKGTGKCNP